MYGMSHPRRYQMRRNVLRRGVPFEELMLVQNFDTAFDDVFLRPRLVGVVVLCRVTHYSRAPPRFGKVSGTYQPFVREC